MCGIAGFYGFRNDDLIKKISKELEHRGPDGEGFLIDEKVTLLNRRLAIIDRKGGDQPIYNEDKTLSVVYNGEIYNYQALRKELEEKGHKFSTNSDTEIIVHGYEEWKDECFDKFNGMFAIALYDLKNQELILVRDHFGIKPLYYSMINENNLIFSSEIKPIINSGLIKKEPNDKIIYRYLNYRVHDDQKETFFKDVHKLMPGEMMVIQDSGFKIQEFSSLEKTLMSFRTPSLSRGEKSSDSASLDFSPSARNDKDSIIEFRNKLTESIRLRLISEVPVGTCLSGGLDSSTVVAIVNKLLKEKVKEAESVGKKQNTFSAVFPNSSNNEEKYIDTLISNFKFQISNYKIYPKAEEFFVELEDFLKTQEEPTISTGPYAQYKVMQEAHKQVTVLLDGQGSDEMMAGYLPYYFVYLNQLKKEGKFLTLVKEIIGSLDILTKFFYQKTLFFIGFKKYILPRLLMNKEFAERYKEQRFVMTNDNLKKRLIEDIFHNSLPSLLRYEDKNSMRFSIEGRVPFLDFNLLKYIFSLDDKAIIDGGWNKNILRGAVKDLLPEIITKRRNKIGFTTPEQEWFLKMKNRIYSLFMSESFAKRPYFNQPEILKKFQKFIEGKTDDTMVFWRILNLEMWLRIFFDPSPMIHKTKERSIFSPNAGKKLEITIGTGRDLSVQQSYFRFPIKTEIFQKGDDVSKKVIKHINIFLRQFENKVQFKKLQDKDWFIVLSEKIVAISQGRSYFIWDIKPGFWAKTLSRFVKRTPYGIGLGSPWTMQLAIGEIGVVRVILASILGVLGRLVGARGIFYIVAGNNIRAIDGPTEYSLYPSNVSAKLAPKNPQKAAKAIHEDVIKSLPKTKTKNFQGIVIIDANDLGRNVLGNSTRYNDRLVEQIFKDNPMGQSGEQTPLTIVYSI
ncbi:MAG: asparagine synthase (glutamine-hydrolyzing) [Candidatus Roizmanbacteria bacterium]|nr:MAG: asparagine synthase (glutamine-hydrolyzing) [Candidatus Roizmanbacteria bacterium]